MKLNNTYDPGKRLPGGISSEHLVSRCLLQHVTKCTLIEKGLSYTPHHDCWLWILSLWISSKNWSCTGNCGPMLLSTWLCMDKQSLGVNESSHCWNRVLPDCVVPLLIYGSILIRLSSVYNRNIHENNNEIVHSSTTNIAPGEALIHSS